MYFFFYTFAADYEWQWAWVQNLLFLLHRVFNYFAPMLPLFYANDNYIKMVYIILSFFILLIAVAVSVSFYMYIQDKRRIPSVRLKGRKTAREIPSYELSSWIDDEIAKDKLYRKPDMSVSELAAELGISERRLKRAINNAYNKTVSEYLNDRRVQTACRLLRDKPDMTLDEICFEAGFASLKTFQTTFISTMGQTPDQYRSMVSLHPAS